MFSKVLRDIAKPQWIAIISILKRSTGMSVSELAERLKMSYMGVKQHCDDLVKKEFIDTFRRAKGSGRPEKLYRLTRRLDPLFDENGASIALSLLAAAQRVYGETAAAKLLYAWFQAKTDTYTRKLAGADDLLTKAKMLSKLRSAEGCISSVQQDAETGALSLVEHHQPLRELAAEHDIVPELECELIEKLLACEVSRSVEEISGLVRITYRLTPH